MDNQGFVRITGYCVRCKARRDIVNYEVKRIKTRKGIRRVAKGKCKKCGAGMTKILKTK